MPPYDPDALPAELREHPDSTARHDARFMTRFFAHRTALRVIALVVVAAMFLVPLLVSLASLVGG